MLYMNDLGILGIDGLSRNILNQFLPYLPNFKKIVNNGILLDLDSIVPPLTFGAWNSIISGQNPGKHGNLDLYNIDENYNKKPYFSDKGYRLYDSYVFPIIVNYPASYPRQPSNGGMIVHSWFCPQKKLAAPKNIQKMDEFQKYIIDVPNTNIATRNILFSNIINKYIAVEDSRMALAKALLEKHASCDLFVLVFNTTDWALHNISGSLGPFSRFYFDYLKLLKRIDVYVGWLMKRFENVLIISDHGFEEKNHFFYINNFLKEKNWLNGGHNNIDFKKSMAFTYGSFGGIYLNDERFKCGLVKNSELGIVRNMIKKDLIEINDLYGSKLFSNVYTKNELYHGPYTKNLPDIIIDWNEKIAGEDAISNILYTNNLYFNFTMLNKNILPRFSHRKKGILMAYGENINKDGWKNDPTIIDLCPTILNYHNKDIPKNIDGKKLYLFE